MAIPRARLQIHRYCLMQLVSCWGDRRKCTVWSEECEVSFSRRSEGLADQAPWTSLIPRNHAYGERTLSRTGQVEGKEKGLSAAPPDWKVALCSVTEIPLPEEPQTAHLPQGTHLRKQQPIPVLSPLRELSARHGTSWQSWGLPRASISSCLRTETTNAM